MNQTTSGGFLRILCYGAKIGVLLALYDLARVLLFSPPVPSSRYSIVALFASGFISYVLLGIVLGTIIAVMWNISGWIPRLERSRLDPVVFWWAAAFAILFGLTAGAFVNLLILAFVGLFHPISIAVSLLIIAFSVFFVTTLFYMIFAKVHRAITQQSLIKTNGRLVTGVIWALPVLLIFVSFFSPTRPNITSCEITKSPYTEVNELLSSLPGSDKKEETKYNILLVSVECIRVDHLNTYGYLKRETSPFIDEFSEDSTLFLRNYAQAPWTRPSMASLFTSLYPAQHGATRVWDRIIDGLPNLPNILGGAGYRTVTFYTNPMAVDSRLRFQEAYSSSYPVPDRPEKLVPLSFRPFLCRYVFFPILTNKIRLLLVQQTIDGQGYVHGMRMNQCVREWLRRSSTEPFLVHIHYNDPHDPYLERPLKSFQLNTEARWNVNKLIERYDSEIRFFDQAFRELIGFIEDRGLLDRTIIVLVADHGEEFLDHGQWRHTKTLFEELIHVPLIMRFPDGLGKGMRIETQVRSIDIAPTLLEAVGIPVPGEMEGKSLLPIIRGEEDGDRPAMAQTQTALYSLACLIHPPFKYIERVQGGEVTGSLYDLKQDPQEQEDLAAERNPVMESLRQELQMIPITTDREDSKGAIEPMDDLMRERLKALGYVN